MREREGERERGYEAAGIWKDTHAWHLHGPTIGFDNRIRSRIRFRIPESAYLNPLCRFVCPSSSHVVLCRSSISIALTARRLAWFLCLSSPLSLPLSLSFLLFFSAGFGCQNHKITLSRSNTNTNTNTEPIQYPIPIPIPIAIAIAICTYRRFGHVNF